jgi:antitoxin (DNA-binding transcriptional repressor) of toxin-antitoxin stability system
MEPETINATEAARNFSEILNLVKYQGRSFEVRRGREIVARIVPASNPRSVKVADLAAIVAALPPLKKTEKASLARDLKRIRKKVPRLRTPWV